MLNWLTKRMKRDQKGFTLIELIVVIAILGVLAAIAVPNVTGSMANARENADKTSAQTIANAVQMAIIENKISLPTDTGEKSIVINDLVTNGYLDKVPTPQVSGHTAFIATIQKDGTSNAIIRVYYDNGDGTTKGTILVGPEID